MRDLLGRACVAVLFAASVHAFAQSPFPAGSTEMKGRFQVRGGYSQELALSAIEAASDGKFKAKLTLWTAKVDCVMKDIPVEGTYDAEGFVIEGTNRTCWSYKFVGKSAKEHKFIGTLTTTNGGVSDFHLD